MSDTQNNRGALPRHGALNLLDGLLQNASIPTAAKARLRTIRLHLEALIDREQNPAAGQEAGATHRCDMCGAVGVPDDVIGCTNCGWDEMQPIAAPVAAEPDEMSPEFTDTARAAIAWVLWHHQGGSSPIGQPLRFALGMGDHDPLPDWRIAEAKRYAELAGATTADFHKGRESTPDAPGIDLVDRIAMALHANGADSLTSDTPWSDLNSGELMQFRSWARAALAAFDASPKGGSDAGMADEYRRWVDFYHAGGTGAFGYEDFLKREQATSAEVGS